MASRYYIDPVEFIVDLVDPQRNHPVEALPPCLVASQAPLDKHCRHFLSLPPLSRYQHVLSVCSKSPLKCARRPVSVSDQLEELLSSQPASVPGLNRSCRFILCHIGGLFDQEISQPQRIQEKALL